jgi:hypothetical protein
VGTKNKYGLSYIKNIKLILNIINICIRNYEIYIIDFIQISNFQFPAGTWNASSGTSPQEQKLFFLAVYSYDPEGEVLSFHMEHALVPGEDYRLSIWFTTSLLVVTGSPTERSQQQKGRGLVIHWDQVSPL